MKRAQLLILFVLITNVILAQKFGNEWINPNQKYLKIPITKEGIFKLDYSQINAALNAVGSNISSTDPNKFQLFFYGQEQFIWVEGQGDNSFDSTDFILFYGEKNDGRFDEGLYIKPEYQVNPYYSLFSDTAWYYLTWEDTQNGKRYTKSDSTIIGSKTNQNYILTKTITSQAYSYHEGERDNAKVSTPLYQEGEGWVGSRFYSTVVRNIPLYTRNFSLHSTAPTARVQTVTVGQSNSFGTTGNPNHGLIIEYGSSRIQAVDTAYQGYKKITHAFDVPTSNLSYPLYLYFKKKPLTPEPPADNQATVYAEVTYAHDMRLNNESQLKFWLKSDIDTSLYQFTGAQSGFYNYAFDLGQGVLIKTVQSGTNFYFTAPPGTNREVFITRTITAPDTIIPAYSSSSTGIINDYSGINTDSAFLILTNKKLRSSADQYAAYRRSTGFVTHVIDVQDIYEAFGYGNHKHPLAIKNFLRYLESKPSNKPAYLFLLGKSVKENITRKSASNSAINLVPTIGVPPADNMYTTEMDRSNFAANYPVGRLAANSLAEVDLYLSKLMQHESENNRKSPVHEEKIWTKMGLHFVGGETANEQGVYDNFMRNYANTWRDTLQGGAIKTFKRSTGGSVQNLKFDSVKYFLDKGVALMSFFGHGSGGQLGINVGEPEDYDNAGRYPVFIANSCNVGDFHGANTTQTTINEKWILTNQKGAIGFIATTSAGLAGSLDRWSSNFYKKWCLDDYGSSVGQMMISASKVAQGNLNIESVNRTCLEMNLHGDPAIKMYPKEKPDFSIRNQDVSTPDFISVDKQFAEINYTVYNLGKATDTIIPIHIQRIFPNGSDTVYVDTIKGVKYSTTASLRLFINNDKSVGANQFKITIDPNNLIDEIYPVVNNSTGTISVNVTSDDLIPVHPGRYSIQPSLELKLSGSTSDPNAPFNTYQFEIDQTDAFNSPNKKSGIATGKGGIIQWNPELNNVQDSTVFYWRCSPVSKDGSAPKWRESSFQYIPNETGWSQYEFDQYEKNSFSNLSYNKPQQIFEFGDGKVNIAATNQGNPRIYAEYFLIKWSINGNSSGRLPGVCAARHSMLISVIDPRTFESWATRYEDNGTIKNPNNYFRNFNDYKSGCAAPDAKFQFAIGDSLAMDSMIYMVNQVIPDSFYVLVMSGINGHFQDSRYWKNRHYRLFEDLGADSIRYIPNDNPYILFAQKGNPNSAIEIVGQNRHDFLSFSTNIQGKLTSGTMNSVIINPSSEHKSLHWHFTGNNPEDSLSIYLSGENNSGQTHELLKIEDNEFHINDLQNRIPQLQSYSNLTLTGKFIDSLASGAPQLKHWFIIGNEGLELALDPNTANSFYNDTLTQGEDLSLQIGVRNLSSSNMKRELRTRIVFVPLEGQKSHTFIYKSKSLTSRESDELVFKSNTANLSGRYTLLIEINPKDSLWEEELEHFNNLYSYSFYVIADKTNPLLDVTFDGVRILDGDIVSPQPQIVVELNDENEFKLVQDTSAFELFLSYPNGSTKRIYFNSTSNEDYEIEFEPAKDRKNVAKVHYNPNLKTDGIYELEINAKDASNNNSGNKSYKISFEVINKSTITQIVNYPNPFSTSTQFVFTLTGSQIPDYFRIQILTATGKVVKEIDQGELGPIRIGRNITDYAWDGKDEFGDQLANGVYFYRVITKISGEEIERRNTKADSYFKEGFGKMYLLR